jgi:S1-C subfamily serine protease
VPASLPAGDLPRGVVLTNGRGEFELGNLEPGRVSISAFAVDVGRGTAEGVEVRSGEVTSDVRILLTGASPDTESDTRAGVAVTLAETSAADGQKIIIVQVAAGSEAERADLKVGDVILRIDGEPVSSLAEARARLGGFENSDVLIEVQRADTSLKLRVRRQQLRH